MDLFDLPQRLVRCPARAGRLAAVALAASVALAGCATTAPAAPGTAGHSASGITVYGTADVGVSRTGR